MSTCVTNKCGHGLPVCTLMHEAREVEVTKESASIDVSRPAR